MNHKILNKRASGILLHVTSLPSQFGIGDLGADAQQFVDFLSKSGQRYWQILPVTPIDPTFGNSPYSSASAFASNTLLMSPDSLIKEGWLKEDDLKPLPSFPLGQVDYDAVRTYKYHLFDRAFDRFKKTKGNATALSEFAKFCLENQDWLDDYSLFVILKNNFKGKSWSSWPKDLCHRKPSALIKAKDQFSDDISQVKFLQYIFFKQWDSLKSYARNKGIHFIGDIPIYVNLDSADVWSNPQLFKLDQDFNPICAAGVPPDYFSETGQRWGNPIYNWDRLKETRFKWWSDRIAHNLKLFDYARIDHFRGFISYWEIPALEKTAINGQWVDVPYEDFFTTLRKNFHDLPLIAEDLGVITPDVTAVMNRFGFPGMKVLMFAFGGNPAENPYMPENHIKNCVLYTGTHDNNTSRGWFENDLGEEERRNLFNYFGNPSSENIAQLMVSRAIESIANTVILPIQDVLGLGQEARMNIPGTAHGNWSWRLDPDAITDVVTKEVLKMTKHSRRDV